MGLGDFMKDVGHAGQNVYRGASYVADLRNLDNIGRGAAKTAQFIGEHPGVVKDVGVAIAKDQLKPQNLAINAALIAATMAGGAAAPALAARFGMSAKAGIAGVEAATEIGRVAKVAEESAQGIKVAKEAIEVGKETGRIGRAMEQINEIRSAASPITTRTAAFRTQMGEKVLAGAEGEAGLGRQVLANAVQGTGGIGKPARMVGQTEQAYKAQQATRYIRAGQGAEETARSAPGAIQTAAHPQRAAMRAATQAGKARYGEQFGEPTGEEYRTTSGGQAVIPNQETTSMQQTSVSPNGVPMATRDVGSISNPFANRKLSFQSGTQAKSGKTGRTDVETVRRALQPSQHFWEGPNREAFGGIGTDYDWRTFKQRGINARPINLPKVRMMKRDGEAEGDGEQEGVTETGPSGTTTATDGRLATTPELGTVNAGVRMMSKDRGVQQGRGENFTSGYTYGEEGGNTIVGGKQNANVQGSFVFQELQQPTASSQPGPTAQVGGVKSPVYNRPKKPNLTQPTLF